MSSNTPKDKTPTDDNTPLDELNINEQLLRTIKYTGATNKALMDLMKSQHRQGRMKLFLFAIPILFTLVFYGKMAYDERAEFDHDNGYVAQVQILGPIQLGSSTASADSVIPALRAAFADSMAKGIIVRISTPGGSPSQSLLIHDEMKRLQEVYPDKRLVVIGEESMTSGGYYIAAAAKEIYALEHTYVGSIGVISSMFNFAKVAENLEVDRLVITSGKSKSKLDQFLPAQDKDLDKMRVIANQIHEKFIDVVVESRGDKLSDNTEALFSGDFWLGQDALALGLVDEVTTTSRLLLREFGTEMIRNYSRQPGFIESLKGSLVNSSLSAITGNNHSLQLTPYGSASMTTTLPTVQ